jgi:hypothetical protein
VCLHAVVAVVNRRIHSVRVDSKFFEWKDGGRFPSFFVLFFFVLFFFVLFFL